MEYDLVLRQTNFFTDLLADKMDVIRRKAAMYESMGDVEAASKMQEIFHLLKRMYDVSGKANSAYSLDKVQVASFPGKVLEKFKKLWISQTKQ